MTAFEGYVGQYRAQVDIRASIILGGDREGQSHSFPMAGYVVIKEWPATGYERRTLDDGRVQIDLEMTESRVAGALLALGTTIRITERTVDRNLGTLTQVYVGQDFPAAFELRRLIAVETPRGELHNEEPILIRAILNSIPPIAPSEEFRGFNVFSAVNCPVPLLDPSGNLAGYFSSEVPCLVRMTSAE